MSRLTLMRLDCAIEAPEQRADAAGEAAPAPALQPLLLDINALSVMLSRSPASLFRDDAAGRLPAALRIGASKRYRASDIALWIELGCPSRAEFEARRNRR